MGLNYQQQMQLKRWLNKPFITYALVAIEVLVFVVGWLLPSLNLVYSGGMSRYAIIEFHQYWRFVTPMFLHFNLEHIVFNMIVLYFLGRQIEMLFGHGRFLAIFFFSGLLGNVFSFAFNNPNVLSAGVSTANMGLFGAFLVFGYHFRNNPAVSVMMRNFILLVFLNLISGLFINVDFYGHLGGLLGGALTAAIIALPKNRGNFSVHLRIISGVIFIFLCIICVLVALKSSGLLV